MPLWTTAAIPVLWIFSGLACAVGLIEILAAAGKLDAESPRWLHAAGWAVHGGEAFVLFAFVLTALSGTPGAAAGAESLISGSTSLLFWGGAVGCGLLIPCITACLKSLPAAALGGAAALIGALSLRAAILFAGHLIRSFGRFNGSSGISHPMPGLPLSIGWEEPPRSAASVSQVCGDWSSCRSSSVPAHSDAGRILLE